MEHPGTSNNYDNYEKKDVKFNFHPQFSRTPLGTPGTMTHQVQTRLFREPEYQASTLEIIED